MDWKPNRWIAAALSLFINPLGMFYVQRPRWAVFYFLATMSVGVVLLVYGSSLSGIAATLWVAAGWLLAITCSVHTFLIARVFAPVSERCWYTRWYGLLALPLALFTVAFLFRSFLYEPFRMPSESMHPTIPEDSFVIIGKLGYGNYGTYGLRPFRFKPTAEVARADIIVFRLMPDPKTMYLMRVIGVPGDHVAYRDHRMLLNGEPIPISFGRTEGRYQYATEIIDSHEVAITLMPDRPSPDLDLVIPPDHFVVLGDSRDNARDSRFIGLVPRENIVGRVVKIFSSGKGRRRSK